MEEAWYEVTTKIRVKVNAEQVLDNITVGELVSGALDVGLEGLSNDDGILTYQHMGTSAVAVN